MSRHRNYCFTSFIEEAKLDHGADEIQYICWGREVCPDTDRPHLQGYVELKGAYGLRRVKDILGDSTVHLEPRRGSRQQAVDYCKKDGAFTEHGVGRQQGHRSDLDGVRTLLSEGGGIRAVLDLGASYQCVRYAEKVLTYRERKRSTPPRVLWLWGPTGSGKSWSASKAAAAAGHLPDDIYW